MNHLLVRFALAAAPLAALLLTAAPSTARADDDTPYSEIQAFDREFGISVYGTGHAGSYLAAGIGGRLRWEPFDPSVPIGFEAYLEATIVDWPGDGFRHDYPNGFNIFFPVRLSNELRLRGFLGFCDILSFVEPTREDAPRADDVLFGAHVGAGLEWAPHTMFSLYLDGQVNGYMGHDRTSENWTGGVDEEFSFFWNAQLSLGATFHFGR